MTDSLLKNALEEIEKYLLTDPKKVVDYREPNELPNDFDFNLKETHSEDDLKEILKDYLKLTVNTRHPQFLNQLFQKTSLAATIGELLAVSSNASMYTYEVSPLGTLMEMELIRKMNTYTGFDDGDGTFTTGGSNSNLIAALCAKHRKLPNSKAQGLLGEKPHVMFVSEKSHYSFQKAAFTLGLGTDNLVKVKTDESHKVIPGELEAAILKVKEEGKVPFFVAATAATTEVGAFDPIDEMADIAKKHDCWMHVDGSWGGSIILSENQKYLFKGLERADSFAWNAHKLMNVPLISAALLVKDSHVLQDALSSSATDYIFHDDEEENYDLGVKSLQCGKRNDVLKLWFAWKAVGDAGFQQGIDSLMNLAQETSRKISEHPDLELLAPTQSLNINFRYTGDLDEELLNDANVQIRTELLKSGKSMVNYCHLGDILSIRLVLANHDLTSADMDTFLDLFLEAAKSVEAGIESAYVRQ